MRVSTAASRLGVRAASSSSSSSSSSCAIRALPLAAAAVVPHHRLRFFAPRAAFSSSTTTKSVEEHERLVREEFTRQAVRLEAKGNKGGADWYTNADWMRDLIFQLPLVKPYTTSAPAAPKTPFRFLEVAAGTAMITRALAAGLAPSSVRMTAMDMTPAMLDQGKQAAKTSTAASAPIDFVLGNVMRMPFPDQTFDVLTTRWFLHHVPKTEWHKAMAEMWRVTKPGGLIVNMDNEPAANKVVGTRMDDIERSRDPSHVGFPRMSELDHAMQSLIPFGSARTAALGVHSTALLQHRVIRDEMRLITTWLELADVDPKVRPTIRRLFANEHAMVRKNLKAGGAPIDIMDGLGPALSPEQEATYTGFRVDASTETPEQFHFRCILSVWRKPTE